MPLDLTAFGKCTVLDLLLSTIMRFGTLWAMFLKLLKPTQGALSQTGLDVETVRGTEAVLFVSLSIDKQLT